MDEENESIDNDVIDTQEVNDAVEETEGLETSETEESQADDDNSTESEIEELEFDFGGNKKKWAKNATVETIAEDLNAFTKGLWSDYTKKSQSIAEKEKVFEARLQAVDKLHSMNDDMMNDYAKGLNLKNELQQLTQIDISQLWNESPDEARRLTDMIARKRDEFNNTIQSLNNKELQLNQSRTAFIQKAHEEGVNQIKKAIPAFNPDEVIAYAKTQGVKESDIANYGLNPYAAITTYKAMMYDKMQAKLNTKPAIKEAKPLKAVVSKGGKVIKSLDDMTPEEFAQYRRKQSI